MTRKIGVRPVRMLVAGAVLFCPGALVGCGESQEPTDTKATPAATKAPAAAVVPTELTGSWTRTFTRAEVARGGNWHGSPGEYTIKFARDGSVGIYYPHADVANDCTSRVRLLRLGGQGHRRHTVDRRANVHGHREVLVHDRGRRAHDREARGGLHLGPSRHSSTATPGGARPSASPALNTSLPARSTKASRSTQGTGDGCFAVSISQPCGRWARGGVGTPAGGGRAPELLRGAANDAPGPSRRGDSNSRPLHYE